MTASEDGGFHLWSTTSNYVRPSLTKADAHVKYTETSGITFSRDGRQVVTRGGDDTVKRKFGRAELHLLLKLMEFSAVQFGISVRSKRLSIPQKIFQTSTGKPISYSHQTSEPC